MVVRVAFFGTHPQQFNGYSKVVYELCKRVGANHANEVELHIFGFQKFYNEPGYRTDIPLNVHVYDAFAAENNNPPGFGYTVSRQYVERIKPDVVIVFNDLIILTTHLRELSKAANRKDFHLIAYIDQVYLTQHPHYVDIVNKFADSAIAFTDVWKNCVIDQNMKLPCEVLPHGFDDKKYFTIPKKLARMYFNVKDDDFLILNLNRNTVRKRWDICMMAFAEVIARKPKAPIKLVIGTTLKGAHDIIDIFKHELRIQGVPNIEKVIMERIIVPGKPQGLTDRDTNILYNMCDIGINTCEGEGFGLCNFEQAAIGIPQICPNIGGFKDFFNDNNAQLVEPVACIYNCDPEAKSIGGKIELCNSQDFADAIIELYDNEERRFKLSVTGKTGIPLKYRWSDIAKHLVEICKRKCPIKQHEQHVQSEVILVEDRWQNSIDDINNILNGVKI